MEIIKRVNSIPGGLMLVPMVITAVINTCVPGFLEMGGLTTALYSTKGTLAVIGLLTFISGSQLKLADVPKTLQRGGVISIARLAVGYVCAWAAMRFGGMDGFWGISSLAFGITLLSCNPGIYIALVDQYGDDADRAAFGILNIVGVPAATVFIMQAAAGSGLDYMSVISTLVPFFLGMLLTNLDGRFKPLLGGATPLTLICLGFCFGSGINLAAAFRAGFSGLLLTLLYVAISIPALFAVDRVLLRRPGYGAVASASVGGVALVIPGILAEGNPAYLPFVETATAQMALVVFLTSFITPWVTGMIVRRFGSSHSPAQVRSTAAATPAKP